METSKDSENINTTTCSNPEGIKELQQALNDTSIPIQKRFRSLFTLRSIGGSMAIDAMASALNDSSALLRHEIAYCFGQMGNEYAFHILQKILATTSEHPMVRHEAAEAIGALVTPNSLEVLKQYVNDSAQEVAETCQLAVARVDWFVNKSSEESTNKGNPTAYLSVDPAPPLPPAPVESLKEIFLDPTAHIFTRYRAMFALRDAGTDESVLALASAFTSPPSSKPSTATTTSSPPVYHSALLKHEVAFVLGQLQNGKAIPALIHALADSNESAMVRHEAAEALGAIAEKEALPLLRQYVNDREPIVAESCLVALDVSEYFNNTEEFQYADGLKLLLEKNIDSIKKPVY